MSDAERLAALEQQMAILIRAMVIIEERDIMGFQSTEAHCLVCGARSAIVNRQKVFAHKPGCLVIAEEPQP